ncbi:MAG TPA: UvrD-helicase domain-containing protein [Edaphobacter sp.]|nr:UvrD-helicase domain-containing protein [Edaphobacter sp.]
MADLFIVAGDGDSRSEAKDRRPPDWQERERALDVRRSWIVEAPAGSGKTGLLIQRYLKLLADESVEQPEQVLAITFTVKATSEMRERVMAQLEGAARGDSLKSGSEFDRETRTLAEAVLQRDALLGWKLLDHPRRLRIRTIDSVCGEIARSLPVLSGSGGRQRPVEDPTPMYREAARQTLMQLGGNDTELDAALRTVLLHRDGSLGECERLLMEMLPLRNQWGELVPLLGQELDDAYLDGTVLPRIERALQEAIGDGLAQLSRSLPPDIKRELALLAGEMGHAEGYRGNPSPIALLAGMHDVPEEIADHLERWQALIHLVTTDKGNWRVAFQSNYLKFDLEKPYSVRLKELVGELQEHPRALEAIQQVKCLPPADYPAEQWKVAKALFRVLSRSLAELQLIFARDEECDFAELGLLAKAALEHGGIRDLSEALGIELRHLLVDEMQDTSTSQHKLIELLTQGWDGHSQTVFLVGDPKQSIYLFRQARVERFIRMMQTRKLSDLPLGSLQLTANFRSQRELVDAFNEDFALLFPLEMSAANPEEVPYVEAQAVRDSSGNGALKSGAQSVAWHTRVLGADEDGKGEKRRQARAEAQQVRSIVEQWRARPLPEGRSEPWKIAVLVRSRNVLGDIVAEFNDEAKGAVPFRAVDIEPLGERQEVLDLFALTRALLHPADRTAWFAMLHAPWCGLGIADLHVLAGADDPQWAERSVEDAIAVRADLLSEESCARLMRIWPVLHAARMHRTGQTTSQWVERTWRSLSGDAYLKGTERANARRYLQLLDEVEKQAGTMDLGLLKRRLKRLYAETAALAGAVDLMTIHGAKGLEWDVVMVPGLEKKAQANREKLLNWSEIDSSDAEAAQIVLAPIAERGEGSKDLNSWLRQIVKAREAAERKRLFYVACTRAREELHLFASPKMTAKGEICREYGSLLATAWPVAERHFAEAAAEPQGTAKLFEMSSIPEAEDSAGDFVGDIAATEEETARPAILRRLPLGFDTRARFSPTFRLSYGETAMEPSRFERPEGSFEARVFGNAVHAFLELLAKRLADGVGLEVLLREIAGWTPRIAAMLRGDGLAPKAVDRLAARVKTGLSTTLKDAEGLWVLGPREDATSEFALTSWGERRSSVRLDRVFRAGAKPLDAGNDCLWIVDYKTATHGREGVQQFLAEERVKYGPQMDAYARMMVDRVEAGRLRVGLYYPMLARLVWWAPAMPAVSATD